MRVDKELMMIRIVTGSRLYGTYGPHSDYDYKAIVLPSIDSLLLNKKLVNRKEKPVGVGPQDKMLAGETETEYLPLQIFFDDFFNGQTYALEIAFAVKQGLHESFDWSRSTGTVPSKNLHQYDQQMMSELIDKFLTRNVKKMMGYAISQARLYGVKTERYSAVKAVVDVLNFNEAIDAAYYNPAEKASLTLSGRPDIVDRLLKIPHVKLIELLTGDGGDTKVPGIDITGKQYPLTNKIVTVKKSIENVLSQYGERVKEFDGEGVDWKALSHAIRIVEQVLELSTTGVLTFPRPNADYLRRVKAGEVQLAAATEYMNKIFSEAEFVVDNSVLQERTPALEEQFEKWKLVQLRGMYRLKEQD